MTVPGYVRGQGLWRFHRASLPNLSRAWRNPGGPAGGGPCVGLHIKSILPERMKIKLLAIERLPPEPAPPPPRYFIREGKLHHWYYAPPSCQRPGPETLFDSPTATPKKLSDETSYFFKT